jgi:DNA-binding beta-propeller fold protein YncE
MPERSILSFGISLIVCAAACGQHDLEPSTAETSHLDLAAARRHPRAPRVPQPSNAFTTFETLQVRPLALSADGQLLFVANTPDSSLEIFSVRRGGLRQVGSVSVGLEPIALAVRSECEVWVVNHLSDSVSVVDVSDVRRPVVMRTLLVGDEPRDIVFAGPDHDMAFITTAHRGQNSPDDPDLFTPGVGRADVWVFDANDLGDTPEGTRLAKLTLFGDTPRALAASADGNTVYAAAFLSGNQTTAVADGPVSAVYPNGVPGAATINVNGHAVPQPATSLIVKWRQGEDGNFHWLDAYGTVFDAYITIQLPDHDVFAIDASQRPPVAAGLPFAHVGTTLFNMAVNPKNGKVYVSNTEAHNDVRFSGHAPGFTSVLGNAVDSRITVIDPAAATVATVDLNPHLDHAANTGDASLSRAFPQDVVVSGDGRELYVVAQGSSKLLVYATADLEAGAAPANAATQVLLSGGGPSGVVVDDRARKAYVLTRFDNSISIVDLDDRVETAHIALFNPEPPSVTQGRRFLYDATRTSALGDQACASCHIGGDLDGLAWDLGDPGALPLPITTSFAQPTDVFTAPPSAIEQFGGAGVAQIFSTYMPVKGPMTTQSLRGLDNHGPMHWRGDRNGAIQQNGLPFLDAAGAPVASAQPNSGTFDEMNAFMSFNVAFPGLNGSAAELEPDEMASFARFALEISYPPNPIRNLDGTLTSQQQAGRDFFFNTRDGVELPVDRVHSCGGCHALDPNANEGLTAHPGFFGSDGRLSFDNESQLFKVSQLRNAYQKLGMYGASVDAVRAMASIIPRLNPPVIAVRGFGYNHDGVLGTIEQFTSQQAFVLTTVGALPNVGGIPFFSNPANPFDPSSGLSSEGLALRRAISAFVLAFDTNLAPIVGQQLTLTRENAARSAERLALLEAQASAGACDLVVHANLFGRDAGFVFSNGSFVADSSGVRPLSPAQLVALVKHRPQLALTLTAVPPGSGWRIGIDRDADGYANGDELDAGSDPADPESTP